MWSHDASLIRFDAMDVKFSVFDILSAWVREFYVLAYLATALMARLLLEVLLYSKFTGLLVACWAAFALCCQEQQSEIPYTDDEVHETQILSLQDECD
jgi:hypothetical protein